MVGVPGIEPGTSSLSGTRSNQLSYTPAGIRPDDQPSISPEEQLTPHQPLAITTPSELQVSHWWRQPGSNRRPRACKARALPAELCPRLAPAPMVPSALRAASGRPDELE
jgi:hypothetical protein